MSDERAPRADKVAVVDEVKGKFSGARAAVITEYRGLDVHAMAELRTELRKVGGEYKVYKNTLVRRAVTDLGLADEIAEMFSGPSAIAFAEDDAVGIAKALKDFAKTNEMLVIKGGLLGDVPMDEAGVRALADLPSREELLSRLAGGLASPMQKTANLLGALPRKFAYGLAALIEKGGASDAPEPEAAPAAEESAAEESAPADEAAPAAEADTSEPSESTTEQDQDTNE